MYSYDNPGHQQYFMKREPFRLLKEYYESFGIIMSDGEFFSSIILKLIRNEIAHTQSNEITKKMNAEKLNMKHLLESKAITQNQNSVALKLFKIYLALIKK